MSSCRRILLARGFLTVVACVVLCTSFGVARHFVPQGLRQLITVEHQIRRVLRNVERETLRSGATIQKTPVVVNSPLELSEVPLYSESVVPYYRISSVSKTPIEPKNFILESSPVLNL
jgi:hypothetical protein